MIRYRLSKALIDISSRAIIYIGYHAYGIEFVSSSMTWLPRALVAPTLMRFGASIGTNLVHKDSMFFDNVTDDFRNLQIGNNCYIGKSVFFDLPKSVLLEDEVVVSGRVMFLTHADTGNRMMSSWYPRIEGSIKIGSGSWIGAGAIILPGVELGRCCVVGAGAVVNKSWPSGSVIAGVPARLINQLQCVDV